MAEKEEVYNNMTEVEAVKKLAEFKTEILENFSKAYLAETGLLPSEVELHCQQLSATEHVYSFRRKDG